MLLLHADDRCTSCPKVMWPCNCAAYGDVARTLSALCNALLWNSPCGSAAASKPTELDTVDLLMRSKRRELQWDPSLAPMLVLQRGSSVSLTDTPLRRRAATSGGEGWRWLRQPSMLRATVAGLQVVAHSGG